MRSGIGLVCLAIAALAVNASSEPRPQDRLTYLLEASTTVENGFRASSRTVYTYYRVFGETKYELWRIGLREKYASHWIGPNGRVWVLTDTDLQGRTPARLWVRDVQANELARVQLPEAVRYLVPDLPELEMYGTWNFNAEKSGFTELDYYQSQFRLVLDGHGEFHINELYSGPERFRYIVTWNSLDSTGNRLDEILMGKLRPQSTRPLANEDSWEVWESHDNLGKGVLAIYYKSPGRSHVNVKLVQKQYALDALPSYVAKTPSNRILWFTFPASGLTKEARLTVYGGRGAVIGEIDLKETGGFKSARAAQGSLDYTSILIQKGNRWVPLQRADWYYTSAPETIKIVDNLGFQYVIKIDGYGREESSVVCERLPVEGFSRKKEPKYVGYSLVDEKIWQSANGEFEYRLRKFEDGDGNAVHRQTLLRKDDRVKEYEHEFWSLRAYIVPLDAIVTNSGRVLTLNVGEITNGANGEQVEIALLIVRDYNGDQTISLNLLTERLLGTYDLAEKADMRGFTVAYDEPESEARFEGAVVRRYARESYTWVLPDRDPIKLYLGEIGPGVGYTLFWDRS